MAILRQSRLCRNLEEKELNLMEQEGTVRTYSRGRADLSGNRPAGFGLYAS